MEHGIKKQAGVWRRVHHSPASAVMVLHSASAVLMRWPSGCSWAVSSGWRKALVPHGCAGQGVADALMGRLRPVSRGAHLWAARHRKQMLDSFWACSSSVARSSCPDPVLKKPASLDA